MQHSWLTHSLGKDRRANTEHSKPKVWALCLPALAQTRTSPSPRASVTPTLLRRRRSTGTESLSTNQAVPVCWVWLARWSVVTESLTCHDIVQPCQLLGMHIILSLSHQNPLILFQSSIQLSLATPSTEHLSHGMFRVHFILSCYWKTSLPMLGALRNMNCSLPKVGEPRYFSRLHPCPYKHMNLQVGQPVLHSDPSTVQPGL